MFLSMSIGYELCAEGRIRPLANELATNLRIATNFRMVASRLKYGGFSDK